MFSNTDEILTYDLDSSLYGILDREFLPKLNMNSTNFKMIDFDVCSKGYSIAYKKNLFISFF